MVIQRSPPRFTDAATRRSAPVTGQKEEASETPSL